jgi:excinuclease ABC subunit C
VEGTAVAGLFNCPPCFHFGPTAFDPTRPLPDLFLTRAGRPAALHRHVRRECPRRPGVYGMLDAHGELIYVGKAKSLRARLLCYFRPHSRDPKAGRILARTAGLAWEYCPSEFAALHRELELIRRWRPRFNVQGQPKGRRRTYVCLGRPPAPYVFLAGRPPAKVLAGFGPVPAGQRAGEAVRRLNDEFGLRDCSQAQTMVFADQAELFPVLRSAGCLRYEIGTCLGPCAAGCSRDGYSAQVKAARSFLAGGDRTLLDKLERDMAAAAAAIQFERAAALRDRLDVLRWLCAHLDRVRQAREELSFIYPVAGEGGKEWWYLIHEGRTAAVVAPPADGPTRAAAAAGLRAVFGQRTPGRGTLPADQVDGLYLVLSWFRRHPAERECTLTPAAALERCE